MVLVTLLALHLAAVLKHQFVDRDRILSRMVDGLRRGQTRRRTGPGPTEATLRKDMHHDDC